MPLHLFHSGGCYVLSCCERAYGSGERNRQSTALLFINLSIIPLEKEDGFTVSDIYSHMKENLAL